MIHTEMQHERVRQTMELDLDDRKGVHAMRVAMITTSISRAGGGITPALMDLSKSMLGNDCALNIISLEDSYSLTDRELWGNAIRVETCRVIGPRFAGFAPKMYNTVRNWKPNILHRHGLWNFPSQVVARYSRTHHVPYLISIHGMLNRAALQVSHTRKNLYSILFERKFLQRAACIHALSHAEATAVREYGIKTPIAVIPNGIDPVGSIASSNNVPWPNAGDGRKTMLYIGRLHPIKGLPLLLKAFARVDRKDWRLVIAGWEQLGHRQELETLVSKLGIVESVDFIGPTFDIAKEAALQHCDSFVLPSTSEAQPVSVLEAWARGVPAIVTHDCNLPEAARENMSIICQRELDSMVHALSEMFTMTTDARRAMGIKARKYSEKNYCWKTQACKMLEVYRWIQTQANRPYCVDVDY